ncbi:MAG: DMT family transporter [Solirubrobacteraceae bacterium]|nr:DMT family transporter [Solirubrobacteraceae bacterium]
MVARSHTTGVALTLTSAAGFGATGVLAKAAYGLGAAAPAVLGGRFALAALALWALVALRRPTMPPASLAIGAVALGAILYGGEATLYFAALERIDVSLVALIVAVYPVLVVAAAIAIGREQPNRARTLTLVAALAGTALVLGGAQIGAVSTLGLLLAALSAVGYAAYVLVADRFAGRMDGTLLAALVITGATVGALAYGAAGEGLRFTIDARAWLAIGALAALCTVMPIATFLIALPRVGPGTASILSTFEPVVAVALAAILLGETLGATQAAGAALVVGSIVALQLRAPGRVAVDEPAVAAAAAPTARTPAQQPA